MQPTSEELKEFVLWAQKFQPDALEKIKRNNFIFDNLEDPWQKLAFTLKAAESPRTLVVG